MSRGKEVDPAAIYGDNYKTDNRGKKLQGPDKMAVLAPKPYGEEGRKVEVKAADEYEDELEAKMARMLNRNAHTKAQDASAKAKGDCAGCHKTITEDDHWVSALNKTFHRQCFKCSSCHRNLSGKDEKYFEKGDLAVCNNCEQNAAPQCAGCHQPCRPDQASVKALEHTWHTNCFMCNGCHKKLAEEKSFHEKEGKPYCKPCFEK